MLLCYSRVVLPGNTEGLSTPTVQLMVKEHKSMSAGCISGSPTFFSGVFLNIKKQPNFFKVTAAMCSASGTKGGTERETL